MADDDGLTNGVGRLTRRGLVGGAVAALAGCSSWRPVDMPEVELPALPGLERDGQAVPGIVPGQFRGRVSVLNVFASWCPDCHVEHEALLGLARQTTAPLVGIAFQDQPERVVAYLRRRGNPYAAVAMDTGVFATSVRQRSIPGTFVVDPSGRAVLAIRRGIDPERVRFEILPAIKRAAIA